MSNNTIHILCTAPVAMQEYSGMQIDVVPFIDIRPRVNDTLAREIEALHHQSIDVVFTSAHAVTIVGGELGRDNTNWRIYCISHATRDAVLNYYGRDAVKATAKNGATLAHELLKQGDIKDIVFFCGSKRRDELIDRLKIAHVNVREVVVYETAFTPKKIEQRYDAILFFSPTGVQSFFSMNTVDADTVLFAIGTTTGNALRAVTNNAIFVGDEPDKEQLLNKAVQYMSTRTIKDN